MVRVVKRWSSLIFLEGVKKARRKIFAAIKCTAVFHEKKSTMFQMKKRRMVTKKKKQDDISWKKLEGVTDLYRRADTDGSTFHFSVEKCAGYSMECLGKKRAKRNKSKRPSKRNAVEILAPRYNARVLLKRRRRCTRKERAQVRRLHEQGTYGTIVAIDTAWKKEKLNSSKTGRYDEQKETV